MEQEYLLEIRPENATDTEPINPARKQLEREVKAEALRRMEDAARSVDDYKKVVTKWNDLDKLSRRRNWRWEVGRPNAEMLHWDKEHPSDEKGRLKGFLNIVIPEPLNHVWWRQLLSGDFLDVIFDCPYEMHEQTSSPTYSALLKILKENQMEVLYYRAIRQYSPQQLAVHRGQTDRGIRKAYDTLISKLRDTLHEWLSLRYDKSLHLTLAQTKFMEGYRAGTLDDEAKRKHKKGKKKTAIDENDGK